MEQAIHARVERLSEAHDVVKNYTIGACAVGFVPIPLLDLAALTGIQLKMMQSIANIYDVPFSKNIVKSLITSLVSGTVAVTTAMPLASLLKAVPIIGHTSGIISISAIGGGATYAVGKVFIAHFESGGTFLDFDAKKVQEHFKALYEEGKKFAVNQKAAGKA